MTLRQIELNVKQLKRSELAAFRRWFQTFDAKEWDQQLEKDARSGKLSRFGKEALSAFKSRRVKEL